MGEELAGGTKGTASGSKSSIPRMVDGSTLTDQGVVSMTVEEFNQVLNLVASGIQLASANTQGIAVQVEFFPKCVVFYKIESTFSDISEGWYRVFFFTGTFGNFVILGESSPCTM